MEDIQLEGQTAKVTEEPTAKAGITLEEEKAHDAVNDFGENMEDGFGNVGGGDFGEFMDLNLDIGKPAAEVSGMCMHVFVCACL